MITQFRTRRSVSGTRVEAVRASALAALWSRAGAALLDGEGDDGAYDEEDE
ncbi:MAG: hypothetical protein P1T08_08175 [Acidimicrobiia bacterium]|nr:hypothetical protein [Acidimicrobiia bacterium]